MRSIFGAALLLGATVSACAAISGLDGYTGAAGDGSAPQVAETGPTPGDDAPAADDPAAADDGPATQDVWEQPDGVTHVDTGTPPADASRDAPPPCGPSSCNGCCTSTGCHGGLSVATCGTHGATCSDCTSQGGACNAGVCGAPPKDAGSMTVGQCSSADISKCTSCAAFLYTSCCKSDHTCGCQWTGFAPCQ